MPQLQAAYRTILKGLGEDPNREGIVKTPKRAAEAMLYLTKGYKEDLSGTMVCFVCFIAMIILAISSEL